MEVTVLAPASNAVLRISPDSLNIAVPAGRKSEGHVVTANVDQGLEYVRVDAGITPSIVMLDYPWQRYAALDQQSFARYQTPFTTSGFAYATSPGVYNGYFDVIAFNSSVRLPWTATITASAWSPPTLAHVVNAASQLPAPLVRASIYALHGSGIGGVKSTEVRVGGRSATLLYVSPNQVNFVTPGDLQEGRPVSLEVLADSLKASTWDLPAATAAPAIFTADSSGRGAPAGVTGPVERTSNFHMWITGHGDSETPAMRVTVGGRECPVVQTSTAAAGVLHLIVRVSEDVEPGLQPVAVSDASASSQPGVFVLVR